MRRSRSRLTLWFSAALSFIAFVAGFNIAVDPFGYFGTNRVGYYFSSEREIKANLVRSETYDAILLGDSRIAFTDPFYARSLDYDFLNAAFADANLRELYELLLQSRLDRVRLVVLGLMYDGLKDCPGPGSAIVPRFWDDLRYSASWSQLGYALEAVWAWGRGMDAAYQQDGSRAVEDKLLRDMALGGARNQMYWRKVADKRANWDGDLDFKAPCLAIMRDMQALSERHGFELVVVFLPYNNDIIGDADWASWLERHGHHLQRLKEIVPGVVDLSNSHFSDRENFWHHDAVHFTPQVGARIIEEALRQRGLARAGS